MKAFEREIAVAPDGAAEHTYRGELSEEWCALSVPQGGIVAGVAASAMAAALDAPALSLRSITSVFAAPVRTGRVDIDVRVLRHGRSMAQATATVRSVGEPAGTTAVAVFGAPRVGFGFTDLVVPDAPPPEECPSFRDGPPDEPGARVPFAYWRHHVEGRAAIGHAPWEEFEPTSSERVFWYRFDDPPRLADGRLHPLALLTLSDTMPGAVGERMGGGLPEWWAPSADLTVHLLAEHRGEWVLARNRARHAGDGYASLEVELWDAESRTLCAYATQLMIFTFPDGPPPPEAPRPPGPPVTGPPAALGLLAGMRVLDLSAYRPMPHATQILADLGAEVLKVEPPGGDPMRAYPDIFASVARGKRSVVLDLRTDAGRTRAHELVADADVVCESWRPGVADRLGVGYEAVVALRPDVIYCSLSGFGQDGPLRDVPGHDVNFQAIAGAVAPRGGADPEVPRLPAADLEGGTVCALLICAAWARRLAHGTGERIDVAMADVVAWWVGPRSGTVHVDADGPTAGSPGYGVFRARDGEWVALGVLGEPRLWDAICRALRLDALLGLRFDERLARAAEVDAAIAGAVAGLDRDEVLARLVEHGAPATPVLTPEQATDHPQLRARGFHVASDAGLVAGLPARLASGGRVLATHVPEVDEHPGGFAPR